VVDLEFPQDLDWQRKYQLFPFAPCQETVSYEDLSEYQKSCLSLQKPRVQIEQYKSAPHLTLSFKPKVKYAVHHRELQFYVAVSLTL